MKFSISIVSLLIFTIGACKKMPIKSDSTVISDKSYFMPAETSPHEGTWLQWPHQYQYGLSYRNSLDKTWVDMCKILTTSENVHIIAYNEAHKTRIINLLANNNVSSTNIDFFIFKTDDVWVRDNGPIYVFSQEGKLVIEDWGFSGWGNKTNYANCNVIPEQIAKVQNIDRINLNEILTIEGGAVELDGQGTLMACKSSILNSNRNKGVTQEQAEKYFSQFLGATNIIWLDGQAGLEITDQHIDGFAKFGNDKTIVTMSQADLLEYDVTQNDINTLYNAKNKNGEPYSFLKIPLTKNFVVTTEGKNLGYKGSYVNYYIANTKVLVPNYNDSNDEIANNIIQTLYPKRTVVGIDVRNLYENGGMIHCVTQQQPLKQINYNTKKT